MRTYWIWLIFLLSLALGSCAISQAGAEEAPQLLSSEPQSNPSENSPAGPLQLELTLESTEMPSTPPVEKFVMLSKNDLASRLGVEANRITLIQATEKLWLNSALGCPRPGVFYPSGRVPGFQIWLEVDGAEYIYNTDFQGTVFPCPELNPHLPNTNTDPTPGVPIR